MWVFVGLSACVCLSSLRVFDFYVLGSLALGYRDEKTGPLPSRNSCSVEGQRTRHIIIWCGMDVKRRL